jgi:predicted transcriptional regulator YheO
MEYLTIILVIIIVGLGWFIYKGYKKSQADEREILALQKESDEYKDLGKGLAEYNAKLQAKKEENKEKILEMLAQSPSTGSGQARVGNRDIAKKLNMSRINVIRYLDELENEGKAKQVGKAGKSVFYQKI